MPFQPSFTSPKVWYALGGVLLIVSALLRILAYPVKTTDYIYFVAKWYEVLQLTPGLTAFLHPFSDYAPLYLYLLKLLSFFPVNSLYAEKTLSVASDLGLAWAVYLIVGQVALRSRAESFFAAAVVFSLPTVILNSSLWGQSDSLYAFGVLFSLYFLLRDRPLAVAIAYGFAFAFKFQAVFFAPILAGYFLWRREYLKYALAVPAVYLLCIIPAWMGGASFSQMLLIYARQSSEYTWLNVSSQSIFVFVQGVAISPAVDSILFWLGMGVATLGALVSTLLVLRFRQPQLTLLASLFCVLWVPYFLPRMHERYFFLADLLSVLFAFAAPRQWYVPVLVVGASLLAYMPFLSHQVAFLSPFQIDLRIPSAIAFLALAAVTYQLARRMLALFERERASFSSDIQTEGSPTVRCHSLQLMRPRWFQQLLAKVRM